MLNRAMFHSSKMAFLRTMLCLSFIGAAACSQVDENLKPAELTPIESEYRFDKVWVKNTGKAQDKRYKRLEIAESDGVLYTTDVSGKVSAVQPDEGKVLWTARAKADVAGGVGLSDKAVLLGTTDGRVIALSKDNGEQLWQARTSSEIASAPQGNADVVIASAIDGRVFAFDADDGSARWSYDHPVPILTFRSNASPLVIEEQAFVAFDNGQLLSFKSSDGQLLWSARVAQPSGKTELDRLVDVDGTPLSFGPFVYAAGYNGRLIAVSRGSGRISWAQDVSTYHHLAAGNDRIVVVTEDSHVKAYDASSGDVMWENQDLHRRGLSAPGVIDNLVVLADDQGILHGLSLEDGRLVTRSSLGEGRLFAQPFV